MRPHALAAALAATTLLALPAGARADTTPYEVFGDSAPNVIEITMTTDGNIRICQDSFCGEESALFFDTINVTAGDGDDTITIGQSSFMTNQRDGITISVHGGAGNDHVRICPDGCTDSRIDSTSYTPGAGTGDGTIEQLSGASPLHITFDDVADVLDGSPGALTTNGTADDDAITYGAAPLDPQEGEPHSVVHVGTLVPYEFFGKRSLTVDGREGADRLETDNPARLADMVGDCGEGRPVCLEGGSSDGDQLVVHGTPGLADAVDLQPLPAGVFGEKVGTISQLAATPDLRYGGIESVRAVLQRAGDGDELSLHGTDGDDRFELTPSTAPRELAIDAVLAQGTVDAAALPHLVVAGADDTDRAAVDIVAGAGHDQVVYTGTAREDALALTPDGLSHAVDGSQAYAVGLDGVEEQAVAGADGDDRLSVRGDVATPTAWGGGSGSDEMDLDGTGLAPVSASLADGTAGEEGFGTVTASGTERLGLGAGGSSVSLAAGDDADTLRFTPEAADAGTLTRDGDGRTYRLSGVAGLLRVDPAAGADTFVLRGTSGADEIPMTRDGAAGTLTAQVGTLLPARLAASTEAVRVEGAEGDDRLLVAGSGGPQSLTVDGGSDPSTDTLVATQNVKDGRVELGSDPSSGIVTAAAPAIGFEHMENVQLEGDDTGTLTVAGSDAADSLTQAGNRVTPGPGAAVSFSRFPALALDAGAGGDQVVVNPRSTAQVSSIAVAGGEAADVLTVNGTELGDAIGYAPTAGDAGRVAIDGGPTVVFSGTESLAVDGRNGPVAGDALTVDLRAAGPAAVLDPGAVADAGSLRFPAESPGSAPAGPPIAFARLGAGSLTLADAPRAHKLTYRGSTSGDVFALTPDGDVRLDGQLPVHTPGVATLVLDAQDGADRFNVPASHPFPGADGGAGLRLDGGGPDTGDEVDVSGGSAAITADLAADTLRAAGSSPIALTGLERTHLDGGSSLAVQGGDEPDVIRYTPTGAAAGTFSRDGDAGGLGFTGVGGAVAVDPAAGADQVVVAGRSTGDASRIVRGTPTTVQVEALEALEVESSTESLRLAAGDGSDTTTVSGSGGPENVTVQGGDPSGSGDRLLLESPTATVTYDTGATAGVLDAPGGRVAFAEIEDLDLRGDGSGGLTVNGSGGADDVGLGGEATPQVDVDGHVIDLGGYPTLVLDGKGGDDRIDVSYTGLGDLSAVHVVGGGGLGDRLSVADQPGSARTLDVRPTAPDAGSFSLGAPAARLTFESTESLLVDGMGGPDELRLVTPSGAQGVRLTPGATGDAGSLRLASLVPVDFQRLGDGSVRIADGDGVRSDTLTYEGTAASDAFRVIGDPNAVTLDGRVPVIPDSVAELTLDGFDGDDAYELTGPLPFTTTRTDGAGPDRADAVAVTGPAGAVTADLGAGTVVGYGGTIVLAGVEKLSTDIGGGTLTQVGSDRDDALCYDPMSPRDGRAYIVGAPGAGAAATTCVVDQRGTNLLHEFTDVGRLLLDPAGGSDQVIVDGTPADDLMTLDLTAPTAKVTLHPDAADPSAFRLPAEVAVDSTESLAMASDNGADDLDVTVHDAPAPTVFLDGEDPSPKRDGDELVVRDGTGRVGYHVVTGHDFGTGTVLASYRGSFTQRIDYAGIEGVTTYKDPKR
jgi:hypothetical protein